MTLVAPETVFLSADTSSGRDVVVEPFVVFGPGVTVGGQRGDTLVLASRQARGGHGRLGRPLCAGCARARGSGEKCAIGNFVEIKEARDRAPAPRPITSAYIGDARVGAGANVGAGTITCNYDGVAKHRTEIGKDAFIGSNSALVAPVKIGEGAYIGSGSVITQDVPADALALARGRQVDQGGLGAGACRDLKAAR